MVAKVSTRLANASEVIKIFATKVQFIIKVE